MVALWISYINGCVWETHSKVLHNTQRTKIEIFECNGVELSLRLPLRSFLTLNSYLNALLCSPHQHLLNYCRLNFLCVHHRISQSVFLSVFQITVGIYLNARKKASRKITYCNIKRERVGKKTNAGKSERKWVERPSPAKTHLWNTEYTMPFDETFKSGSILVCLWMPFSVHYLFFLFGWEAMKPQPTYPTHACLYVK